MLKLQSCCWTRARTRSLKTTTARRRPTRRSPARCSGCWLARTRLGRQRRRTKRRARRRRSGWRSRSGWRCSHRTGGARQRLRRRRRRKLVTAQPAAHRCLRCQRPTGFRPWRLLRRRCARREQPQRALRPAQPLRHRCRRSSRLPRFRRRCSGCTQRRRLRQQLRRRRGPQCRRLRGHRQRLHLLCRCSRRHGRLRPRRCRWSLLRMGRQLRWRRRFWAHGGP